MSEPLRLDKSLVALIHCSRGEAQKYIEGGWVLVDGEVVDLPQFMVHEQKVELAEGATLEPIAPVTLLLNMPEGFDVRDPEAPAKLITPDSRAEDDNSGIRMLKAHFRRLKATAPLQAGATGLLVFTNDWRVERRLVEDASKNEQEYIVELASEVDAGQLAELNQPMIMNKWPLPKTKVSQQSESRLRFALKAPRPEQIAFMCRQVGLTVVAMKRIRIGGVSMGKLEPGRWRYLAPGARF